MDRGVAVADVVVRSGRFEGSGTRPCSVFIAVILSQPSQVVVES